MSDERTLNLVFDSAGAALQARREISRTAPTVEVELCSNQPLPGHEEAAVGSHIGLWAVAGGVGGAAGAIGLVVFTFLRMNLSTGHMDILTLAPMGIITFALTALGAVAGTLAGFLWEARLPRWRNVSPSLEPTQVLLRIRTADLNLLDQARQESFRLGGQPLAPGGQRGS